MDAIDVVARLVLHLPLKAQVAVLVLSSATVYPPSAFTANVRRSEHLQIRPGEMLSLVKESPVVGVVVTVRGEKGRK